MALDTVMLSVIYAGCRNKSFMLGVVVLNVVMISVMAPVTGRGQNSSLLQLLL
jgi:hypothetical protein